MTTLRLRWHHHAAADDSTPDITPDDVRPSPQTRRPRGAWALAPRHLQVLRAISDGRVARDLLYGDLAPWMLDGREVSWSITVLAARRYIVLTNTGLGPAQLTTRGATVLNGRN